MMTEIQGEDLPDLHHPSSNTDITVLPSNDASGVNSMDEIPGNGNEGIIAATATTATTATATTTNESEPIDMEKRKEKRKSNRKNSLHRGSAMETVVDSDKPSEKGSDSRANGSRGASTRRQRSVQFDSMVSEEETSGAVAVEGSSSTSAAGEGANASNTGKQHTRRKSLTPVHRVRSKTVGGKWSVNAVGQVVFKNHESYNVMRQIQMGLRTAISDITPKKNRDLHSKDFDTSATVKWSFPSTGTLHTPPHDYEDFRFYDYGPMAFRHLRERFGIDASHFLVSLCHDKSLSILGTPGKSGALFFYSADTQYILKTITKKESKFLRKILPQYYNHVMSNPSTLITRFYGLYSIKPSTGKNVRFVIMNNVFDTDVKIEERYDLKGSTIGRTASEKELARDNPVLKDMDLLQKKRKVCIGQEARDNLVQKLKTDCAFLESVKIMDYSLLLGIHQSSVRGGVIVDFASPVKRITRAENAETTTTTSTTILDDSISDLSRRSIDANGAERPESDNTKAKASSNSSSSSSSSSSRSSGNGNRASGHAIVRVNVVDEDGTDDARDARPSSEDMSPKELGSKTASFLDSVKNNDRKQRPSILNGIFRGGASSKLHLENQKGHRVSDFQQFHGGILSADGNEIYFLGIIDLLQMWNNRKQMEHVLKGFRYDRNQISSISPKKYATRFLRFMEENIV